MRGVLAGHIGGGARGGAGWAWPPDARSYGPEAATLSVRATLVFGNHKTVTCVGFLVGNHKLVAGSHRKQ